MTNLGLDRFADQSKGLQEVIDEGGPSQAAPEHPPIVIRVPGLNIRGDGTVELVFEYDSDVSATFTPRTIVVYSATLTLTLTRVYTRTFLLSLRLSYQSLFSHVYRSPSNLPPLHVRASWLCPVSCVRSGLT